MNARPLEPRTVWAPSEAAGPAPGPKRCSPVLLDAHGHYYDCFRAAQFLDAAAQNFGSAAEALGLSSATPGHLVVAATARGDGLARLMELASEGRAGSWRLVATAERECVRAESGTGEELVLLAARQLVTREGVEVLALLCDAGLEDGATLEETIAAAREAGALVVVPWGFGKWWFGRGQALRRLVASGALAGVYLGDSANRPRGGRTPEVLRLAERSGVRLLSGTDPLPLAAAAGDAGRYGCVIDLVPDTARPAAALRRALTDARTLPRVYGVRCSPVTFVARQVAVRAARRQGGTHG